MCEDERSGKIKEKIKITEELICVFVPNSLELSGISV
jgi:hypothetical protein